MSYSIFTCSSTSRAPRSTLFPYTTLFRSYPLASKVFLIPPLGKLEASDSCCTNWPPPNFSIALPSGDSQLVQQDRKSTRLNSSHVRSSYAVFCVKTRKACWCSLDDLKSRC